MNFNNEIITTNISETQEFGRKLALSVKNTSHKPVIICLFGELGVGKTTFVQGFAKGLGVKERITSPTFVFMHRYELSRKSSFFYHFDLYRIQSIIDAPSLGLNEIFHEGNAYIVIEWADRLDKLPKERIDIYFSMDSRGNHHLNLKKSYENI